MPRRITNKMKIEIRLMEESDAKTLFELGRECELGSWSLLSYINEYNNPLATYIVLLADGVIVGYAGIWCVVDEAQVMNIGVRTDCRNKGFGGKLMQSILQKAHELGCLSMTLEVREDNDSAIKLYEKMGFEAVGMRENYYPNHINALFMRRYHLG